MGYRLLLIIRFGKRKKLNKRANHIDSDYRVENESFWGIIQWLRKTQTTANKSEKMKQMV